MPFKLFSVCAEYLKVSCPCLTLTIASCYCSLQNCPSWAHCFIATVLRFLFASALCFSGEFLAESSSFTPIIPWTNPTLRKKLNIQWYGVIFRNGIGNVVVWWWEHTCLRFLAWAQPRMWDEFVSRDFKQLRRQWQWNNGNNHDAKQFHASSAERGKMGAKKWTVGFTLTNDLLKMWREFAKPITLRKTCVIWCFEMF